MGRSGACIGSGATADATIGGMSRLVGKMIPTVCANWAIDQVPTHSAVEWLVEAKRSMWFNQGCEAQTTRTNRVVVAIV